MNEIKYFVDLFFAKVNKQQILNNNLFNENNNNENDNNGDFPENSVVLSTNDSSDVQTNIIDDTEPSDDDVDAGNARAYKGDQNTSDNVPVISAHQQDENDV